MDGIASHWLISTAIGALKRLTHRGAIAADGMTGDGCGLLMRKLDGFLRAEAERDALTTALTRDGMVVAGWREVPTDQKGCGKQALLSLPCIEQIFVNPAPGMDEDEFERRLFMARRRAELKVECNDSVFYVPSLSARVLAYKGLVVPANLPVFFKDPGDPRMETSLCVFHQRFSTNTAPEWRLAQPFRYLAHNGEINTISGNRNWAIARSYKFATDLIPDLSDVRPLVSLTGSDSSSLEFLPGETEGQRRLDLKPILSDYGIQPGKPQFCTAEHNAPFDGGNFDLTIRNNDWSIGARVSGQIARRYGNQGMASTPITFNFKGTAGQSFGVWNAGGLNIYLEGDSNDCVGKGMAGGKLVLRAPRESTFVSSEAPIIGNTCLYGATSGTLFAAGRAGERFAVRNSGATAVVEGVGDHGCEYMTGGGVTVLGPTAVLPAVIPIANGSVQSTTTSPTGQSWWVRGGSKRPCGCRTAPMR